MKKKEIIPIWMPKTVFLDLKNGKDPVSITFRDCKDFKSYLYDNDIAGLFLVEFGIARDYVELQEGKVYFHEEFLKRYRFTRQTFVDFLK